MKLILDFDKEEELKITSTDDPDHYYLFKWMYKEHRWSLWYDGTEFVAEDIYSDLSDTISDVINSILHGMVQAYQAIEAMDSGKVL
jgi:hypothetical protein